MPSLKGVTSQSTSYMKYKPPFRVGISLFKNQGRCVTGMKTNNQISIKSSLVKKIGATAFLV